MAPVRDIWDSEHTELLTQWRYLSRACAMQNRLETVGLGSGELGGETALLPTSTLCAPTRATRLAPLYMGGSSSSFATTEQKSQKAQRAPEPRRADQSSIEFAKQFERVKASSAVDETDVVLLTSAAVELEEPGLVIETLEDFERD